MGVLHTNLLGSEKVFLLRVFVGHSKQLLSCSFSVKRCLLGPYLKCSLTSLTYAASSYLEAAFRLKWDFPTGIKWVKLFLPPPCQNSECWWSRVTVMASW